MAKRNTFFEDEKIEKKIDIKQLGRTVQYILPYKKILIMVTIMMLVASVVSLFPPRLLKIVVDEVVVNKDYKQLALVGGGLVLLAAVEIISTFIQTRAMGKMGLDIISNIRSFPLTILTTDRTVKLLFVLRSTLTDWRIFSPTTL